MTGRADLVVYDESGKVEWDKPIEAGARMSKIEWMGKEERLQLTVLFESATLKAWVKNISGQAIRIGRVGG